jgi:arylsulfatase A-like enzyme
MTDSGETNVLYVVLDACRRDATRRAMDTFADLAASNLTFERAVTPASWSLPAHVSMLTGADPSEHVRYSRSDHSVGRLDLVEGFRQRGFTTWGVSANIFASQHYDFDASFDEFHYTNGIDREHADGLDASNALGEHGATPRGYARVLRAAATHENPSESLVNVARATVGRAVSHWEPLRRVPHPWFTNGGRFGYSYDAADNTDRVVSLLERAAEDDAPFFGFVNYMDLHSPYRPPEEYLPEGLSRSAADRLNREYVLPWSFHAANERGDVDEATIEAIRALYYAEARSIDEQLGRLRATLDRLGLLENTLLVVTADHGENLGERTWRGGRTMGHEATTSDAVLEVPLLLAHPALDGRSVADRVTLSDLPTLLTDDLDTVLASGGRDLGTFTDREVVPSASPAHESTQHYDEFDAVPRELLATAIEHHTTVAFQGEWKVEARSDGHRLATCGGERRPYEDAPEAARRSCEQRLAAFEGGEGPTVDLGGDVEQSLRDLGYL